MTDGSRRILTAMTEEKKRTRRGSGDGGLFEQADGKWVAQLSIGPRGHRKIVQRVRPTRAAAKAALDDLKDDLKAGVAPSKRSLGSYLQSWLDDSAKPTISANTYRGYNDAIALWKPIHHIALSKLTAEDIEEASNAMLATKGPRDNPRREPASPKTIRNAQIMLRRALGQAEARGHVRRNVARLVPLRKVARRRHRLRQSRERPVSDIRRGLVFVTPKGYAVNGTWFLSHFLDLLEAAKLERITIHGLRHGAATLLLGAGAHPRVAQELLRHASSRTTMDIYSHVTGTQQREAADLLERAIGG